MYISVVNMLSDSILVRDLIFADRVDFESFNSIFKRMKFCRFSVLCLINCLVHRKHIGKNGALFSVASNIPLTTGSGKYLVSAKLFLHG